LKWDWLAKQSFFSVVMTRNEQQAGTEPRETSPNKGSLEDNQLSFMIGYW